MNRRIRNGAGLSLVVVGLLLVGNSVRACSVPVFRYALERWRSDPYQVVVFHRGKLTADQQVAVDALKPDGLAGDKFANITLRLVDLAGKVDPAMQALWKQQKTKTLPWMVVRYPAPIPPAWAGRLSQPSVTRLLDSPIRREVARRILKGDCGVWVLLESGDRKKDDAAFRLLTARLKHEQSHLKLPEFSEKDRTDGLIDIDPQQLKVAFSVIRLSRNDPAEKLFVEMLLGSDVETYEDTPLGLRDKQFDGQPIAFPVFGRGRVLPPSIGKGINAENVSIDCSTLVGECTCTVKRSNPGLDLVMAVDWDTLVEPQIKIDDALPPLPGLGSFTSTGSDSLPKEKTGSDSGKPTGTTTASSAATAGHNAATPETSAATAGMNGVLRNTLVLLGICVFGVAVASMVLTARRN